MQSGVVELSSRQGAEGCALLGRVAGPLLSVPGGCGDFRGAARCRGLRAAGGPQAGRGGGDEQQR
eukprot:279897-Alexandrium_andersonii.AAC.1